MARFSLVLLFAILFVTMSEGGSSSSTNSDSDPSSESTYEGRTYIVAKPASLQEKGEVHRLASAGKDKGFRINCKKPDFTTIEAALAAVKDNDKVFVCPGTYTHERGWIITKKIFFSGYRSKPTESWPLLLNPIKVNADLVTVQHIHFRPNGPCVASDGDAMLNSLDHQQLLFRRNIFEGQACNKAVYLNGARWCEVDGNKFLNNMIAVKLSSAVLTRPTHGNEIENNNFTGNGTVGSYAVLVENAQSGIQLQYEITNNYIRKYQNGIYLTTTNPVQGSMGLFDIGGNEMWNTSIGIYLSPGNRAHRIHHNRIFNTSQYGVELYSHGTGLTAGIVIIENEFNTTAASAAAVAEIAVVNDAVPILVGIYSEGNSAYNYCQKQLSTGNRVFERGNDFTVSDIC